MKNIKHLFSFKTLFIVCGIFFNIHMHMHASDHLLSTTTEIHSFSDTHVATLLEHSKPEEVVIFFDLDDTVVTSKAMLMHEHCLTRQFVAETVARHPKLLHRKTLEHYVSIAFTENERFLTDDSLPDLIKTLKEKGYMVVGLTATMPGQVGTIKDMKEYRFKELEQLGITFSNSISNTTFTKFKKKHGRQPELYNGIIFCNREKKGKVVKAFLDELSFKPVLIALFDDTHKNVVSVQATAKKLDIPFQGFLYLGARHTRPFDKKRARHQIKHLIKHGQWLCDEEVDRAIAVLQK